MTAPEPRHFGVMPAAGAGLRMGGDTPKQYLPLGGRTVLEHTLENMLSWGFLDAVAVAVAPGDTRFGSLPVAADPRVLTAPGGARRADSVLAALRALAGRAEDGDWIWVHDAVRPCVAAEDVERLREGLSNEPVGAVLGQPVADTLKFAAAGRIDRTLDRRPLWLAQTPQVFPCRRLREALEAACEASRPSGGECTDEAAAVEALGLQPRLVEGSSRNLKITRPGDLALAAGLLHSSPPEN